MRNAALLSLWPHVLAGECQVTTLVNQALHSLGADIIGVNCRFDPNMSLQTIGLMKEALDKEGLERHLMRTQPVGYHTPDTGGLPEAPLGE